MKLTLFLLLSVAAFAAAPVVDRELCPQPIGIRALAQAVTAVKNGAWSNASVWGGSLPQAGDKVVVPVGKVVTLDVSPPNLGGIDIHGTIKVARKATALTSAYVLVHPTGLFTGGTTATPFAQKLTITLTGTDRAETVMGGRVFGAMGGGKIELIGKVTTLNWTQLAAGKTAAVGATKLFLQDWPGWKKGDQIIITSTDFDYEQTEKRTIASVSATAKTITLDAPLQFLHYGNITTVDHGVSGVPITIDERAEVAILTHYIKIQGAQGIPGVEDSETNGYGGHFMVMGDTSVALLQGVELYNMGQKGLLGRYPMHWHNVNNGGSNSWMRNCSTHHSFNRGTTIHKTNNLTISDNVIYDTLGHGYFFEDGKETGNVLTHNLVALVHKGPLDMHFDPDASAARRAGAPAAYWITNPNNSFINNAAAGATPGGFGFWYDLASTPRPGSISADPSYRPNEQPFGVFRGNRAHSIATPYRAPPGEAAWGFFLESYTKTHPVIVEDFTTFKIQGGQVWSTHANPIISQSRLSGDNAVFNLQFFKDSLAVGRTMNPVVPGYGVSGNVNLEEYDHSTGRVALTGYDSIAYAERSVFAGYRGVFKLRSGGTGGGTKDCVFINDANYKTYFIGNVDNRTAAFAEQSRFTIENPEDSFDNGGPGLFTYTELYTDASSKDVAQGAKGLAPDDHLGWWSPVSKADYISFGFDYQPGAAPYQVLIKPAGKDKSFPAVPANNNNGGVVQDTIAKMDVMHRISFTGPVVNETLNIRIVDGIMPEARFLLLALPKPSSSPTFDAPSLATMDDFNAVTSTAVFQSAEVLYIKIAASQTRLIASGYTLP